MKSYHWDELEPVTLKETFLRKLVAGDRLTIARTETERGSFMQRRCFPHETFIIIVRGAWQVHVNGRAVIIGANQVLHIPPYMEHDVEALDHTLALEIMPEPPSYVEGVEREAPPWEDENYLWGV